MPLNNLSNNENTVALLSSPIIDNALNSTSQNELAETVESADCPCSSTDEKNLLQTGWTFWCDHKQRSNPHKESIQSDGLLDSAHYAKNLKQIHTFKTVEEFYSAFTYIKPASQLPVDCNISLFREGCLPMWEEFPNGGMWIVRVKRGQVIDAPNTAKGRKVGKPVASSSSGLSPKTYPLINVMWECLVLACIGEIFAMPEVVGCVLSIRNKENVLSVWNVDNDNPTVRLRLGQKFREVCALPRNSLMRYKDFQQAMKDCSSYRNAQRYLFTNDFNGNNSKKVDTSENVIITEDQEKGIRTLSSGIEGGAESAS